LCLKPAFDVAEPVANVASHAVTGGPVAGVPPAVDGGDRDAEVVGEFWNAQESIGRGVVGSDAWGWSWNAPRYGWWRGSCGRVLRRFRCDQTLKERRDGLAAGRVEVAGQSVEGVALDW
jgi:hypothetical protein